MADAPADLVEQAGIGAPDAPEEPHSWAAELATVSRAEQDLDRVIRWLEARKREGSMDPSLVTAELEGIRHTKRRLGTVARFVVRKIISAPVRATALRRVSTTQGRSRRSRRRRPTAVRCRGSGSDDGPLPLTSCRALLGRAS